MIVWRAHFHPDTAPGTISYIPCYLTFTDLKRHWTAFTETTYAVYNDTAERSGHKIHLSIIPGDRWDDKLTVKDESPDWADDTSLP